MKMAIRGIVGCFVMVVLLEEYLCLSNTKIIQKTYSIPVNAGDVVYTGAVEHTTAASSVVCMQLCNANYKCMTFFYGKATFECIMHSWYNKYLKAAFTETGWKYNLLRDVTGRCPDKFWYRHLDICYETFWADTISFSTIHTSCETRGGKLAAINSLEKHEYYKTFMADRMDLYVCFDGSEDPSGNWVLSDGTNLTYFDWNLGEPNSVNEQCLSMNIMNGDTFSDCPCEDQANTCEYVCEF